MGKGKAPKDTAPAPALSLKMDATNETSGPSEVSPVDSESGFMVPCTVTGLGAGLSGGTLGWVMGFGETGCWLDCSCRYGTCQQAGRTLPPAAPAPASGCFPSGHPPACAAPRPCRRLLDQKLAGWRPVEGIPD